jgi:hypothetical protein
MATATRISIAPFPRPDHLMVTEGGVTAGSQGFKGIYMINGTRHHFKGNTENAADLAAATYAATLP